MTKNITIYFLWVLLLVAKGWTAPLDSKMEEWFNKMNIASNTTSSDYLNSRLGVHFLGGSGVVRSNVYDINPAHLSLPTFSAGCGGIDYTLGALNIASKEEIKKSLKSIASNGVGYAFLLGIETVAPVVASTIKEIQTWANQLNAININSCQISSSLVQGMWPKTQGASEFICAHASTKSPIFDDHIQARHGCRDDKKKEDAAIKKVKENKNFLAGEYNVAWTTLQGSGVDKVTKNLFLNLTGTIVVKKGGAITYFPKLEETLEILQNGGVLKNAYQIAENELDITQADLTIPVEHSWTSKVKAILNSLREKILEEAQHGESTPLTEVEKSLLQTTRFPIGSLLSLMGQWAGNATEMVSLNECAHLIAFERTASFVDEIITQILGHAEAIRLIQIDGASLDKYIKQLGDASRKIHDLETKNFQHISEKHQVIEHLINFDKNLRDKERGV
ncbi:MAG: conjugal transfer protein TraH [Simkania negevensis]|nr:conjugal transfer protein TraH [Simkania negevensis]